MESTLLQTIRFFNSKEIGEIITRKEFLQKVPSTGQYTRDTYRNELCRTGFLQKIGFGKYKRIKNIPENISIKNGSYFRKESELEKLFHDWDEITKENDNGDL